MVLIKSEPIKSNIYIKNMENDFFMNFIFINLRLLKIDFKLNNMTKISKNIPIKFKKIIKKYENIENKMIDFKNLFNQYPISDITSKVYDQLFFIYKSNLFELFNKFLKNDKFLIITDKPHDVYAFYNNNIKNFDIIFFSELKSYLRYLNTENFYNKYKNNIKLLKNNKYNNVFLSFRYYPYFLNDYFHQKFISNIFENINLILSKIENNGNLIIFIYINELKLYQPLFNLLLLYFTDCEIIFNKLVDIPFSYYIIFKNFKYKNFIKYKIKLQRKNIISKSWTDLFSSKKIYLYNNISKITIKTNQFNCFNELNYNYNLLINLVDYIKLSFIKKNKFDIYNYEKYIINYYNAAIINIIKKLKKDKKKIPKKYLEFYNQYKNNFN
jgi:hypothetical protein